MREYVRAIAGGWPGLLLFLLVMLVAWTGPNRRSGNVADSHLSFLSKLKLSAGWRSSLSLSAIFRSTMVMVAPVSRMNFRLDWVPMLPSTWMR